MAFTVGDLARLTGVTVRALHHYDEIGLVRPSERTAAGYRLYTDADVHPIAAGPAVSRARTPARRDRGRDRCKSPSRDELFASTARRWSQSATASTRCWRRCRCRPRTRKDSTMQPDDVKKMFDGFDHSAVRGRSRSSAGATPKRTRNPRAGRRVRPGRVATDQGRVGRDLRRRWPTS